MQMDVLRQQIGKYRLWTSNVVQDTQTRHIQVAQIQEVEVAQEAEVDQVQRACQAWEVDLAVHLHIQEADQVQEAEAEVDQVLHLVTYLAILLWDQHLAQVQVDQEAEVDQDQEIVLQVDHQALQVFQSTVSLIKVKALRKSLCALTA